MAIVWPCIVSVDYLSGLAALTEDTSLITVYSCGVKLQEVLSGLEKAKTLDILMHFCGFSQDSFIPFQLGCKYTSVLFCKLNYKSVIRPHACMHSKKEHAETTCIHVLLEFSTGCTCCPVPVLF